MQQAPRFEIKLSDHPNVCEEYIHIKSSGDRINTRVLGPEDIDESAVRRAAEFFKYSFDNAWQECAFCPSCDAHYNGEGESPYRMSAAGALRQKGCDPELLQDENNYIHLDITKSDLVLPACPGCDDPMVHFHSLEAVFKKFKTRLLHSGRGFISELLLRSNEPDQPARLIGVSVADYGPLRDLVWNEWRPYTYADEAHRPENLEGPNIERLITKLREKYGTEIDEQSDVGINSGVAVLPPYQRGHNGARLQFNILRAAPQETMDMVFLTEVIPNSPGFYLCQAAGGVIFPDILDHNRMLMGSTVRQIRGLENKL